MLRELGKTARKMGQAIDKVGQGMEVAGVGVSYVERRESTCIGNPRLCLIFSPFSASRPVHTDCQRQWPDTDDFRFGICSP